MHPWWKIVKDFVQCSLIRWLQNLTLWLILNLNMWSNLELLIINKLIYDVNCVPFSFLFDESTNNQIKKQYGSFILVTKVWSSCFCLGWFVICWILQCIVNENHCNDFVDKLELKSDYLLHSGMDGWIVNLSFENKLESNLESINTSFLRIGTFSLHLTHTDFRKSINSLYLNTIKISGEKESAFDLGEFFNNLHLLFKLSSARWEDYFSLENVTNVVAQYAKKHVEMWWLSMKYVALHLLEQWPNLREYFLNFLPK